MSVVQKPPQTEDNTETDKIAQTLYENEKRLEAVIAALEARVKALESP